MHKITIVSLGPGAREHLTLGVLETLEKARHVVLRTGETAAARALAERGIAFDTLDDLHEDCEDFDAFVEEAAEAVIHRARRANVVYAVLDAASDETVDSLLKKCPENVTVSGGLPISAPLLQAAGARLPVRVCTATSLSVPQTQDGLLIVEMNTRMLAGECKLKLAPWYGDETDILFFPPSEKAQRAYVRIPLCELDRQKKYDHTAAAYLPALPLTQRKRHDLWDLVRMLGILRGENGCPWDREQTHATLSRYLIEEAHETALAVREEDWEHVAEELGDVLLQVAFQADIGAQYGTFDLSDVTTGICRKMMQRHTHIFGGGHADTAEEVSQNWERMKQLLRGNTTIASALMDVSDGLPALLRAEKVLKKAKNAGLDTQMLLQDESAGALLRALEEMRAQGKCAEEEVHDAVLRFIRQVEKDENAANSGENPPKA